MYRIDKKKPQLYGWSRWKTLAKPGFVVPTRSWPHLLLLPLSATDEQILDTYMGVLITVVKCRMADRWCGCYSNTFVSTANDHMCLGSPALQYRCGSAAFLRVLRRLSQRGSILLITWTPRQCLGDSVLHELFAEQVKKRSFSAHACSIASVLKPTVEMPITMRTMTRLLEAHGATFYTRMSMRTRCCRDTPMLPAM